MAIHLRPENRKSTRNDPATDTVHETEKREASSSDDEPMSEKSKRNEFTLLHDKIEKRCNLVTNGQERREFRKKLWHLFRTDNEAFENSISDGPSSKGDAVEEPSARHQAKDDEIKDCLRIRVLPELGDSPPCLQCSLKGGMACSIQRKEFEQAVRCQRCRRNGETYCIRQQNNLIQPGGDATTTATTADDDDDNSSLNTERAERDAEYLANHVFCYDNILQRDKARLCAVTRDLLGQYCHKDKKEVSSIIKLPTHNAFASSGMITITTQDMALPMWHRNDDPANRRDPDFCPRTRAEYLAEVRARWEARWESMSHAEAGGPVLESY